MKTSNIHKDDIRKKKQSPNWMDCNCTCHGFHDNTGISCPHCYPERYPEYTTISKDKENKIKSKCCNSWVVAEHADEGTSFYKCVACRKACDIDSPNKLPLSNKVCNFCLTMLATMRPDMDNYCSKCGNRYGDKPSKKTEWEDDIFGFNNRGIVEYWEKPPEVRCRNCGFNLVGKGAEEHKFGHIGCPKPNGEYIKNDLTPEKLRKAISKLLHQRDNEIREWIQGMKKEERVVESCDNCGGDGYGKAWYGHGRATGDAWGDRYESTGSMVFCKNCAKDFQIGDEWDGQEIWKRTSDREEHSTIRINSITHPDPKAIGYNACLDDLLTYLSNKEA